MSTLTPNYSFILPGVNDAADQDLWGGYLNANWSSIDTVLAALNVNVPVGMGADYWGTSAPSGWVFPYGQAVNRTTYADLFAILGTTYGVGDGSTTFNLPDKRDRASFGKGDMGGTPAGRITDQSGGWEGDTLGDAGGEETHVLTEAELAAHTHAQRVAGEESGSSQHYPENSTGDTPTIFEGIDTASAGSDTAHNNLPPGIVCNYILYTGVV